MKPGDKVTVGRKVGKLVEGPRKIDFYVVEIDGEEFMIGDGLGGWSGYIEDQSVTKIVEPKTKKATSKKVVKKKVSPKKK